MMYILKKMFNSYYEYNTKPIKEAMTTAPTLPIIPSPPKTSTIHSESVTTRNSTQISDSSNNTSTYYSLPASYILPIIDEKSTLLDDIEFNMLRIVINRIKKTDPKLINPFDISAVIRLEIKTPQYTDIINNLDMTIKQKIEQIQQIMIMELNVVSDTSYIKNPYYTTNKSIFDNFIESGNSIHSDPQPQSTISNTILK